MTDIRPVTLTLMNLPKVQAFIDAALALEIAVGLGSDTHDALMALSKARQALYDSQ